jgi:hypothetical protein
VSTLSTLIQNILGILSQSKKTTRRNKKISNWKKSNYPYVQMTVLYIKDLENATKKLLDINTFSQVAGYKINLQKSVAFSIQQ